MWCRENTLRFFNLLLIAFISLPNTQSADVKDIFNLNGEISARVPRDSKYYPGPSRYGSSSSNTNPLNRAIKPEDSPEAHQPGTQTPVEKRCTRCEYDRYRNDPGRYRDRYYDDDRKYDRYDDKRYDRYDDKRYDRYDRGYERDRYDRYDDRDRYERRPYDRYDGRERDRYYDRNDRDRYDRDRYDRYDRDYDRGFGYDNRGYDYRERNDGYRPWDETYRGTSGFDNNGRGYYFATGRPEAGTGGYWGTGGGYASSWNYNGRDYDRGYGSGGGSGSGGGGGGGGGYYRPRDPYDGGYRTSYLYGRPSSTTTDHPTNAGDNDGVTQNSQQDNTSG